MQERVGSTIRYLIADSIRDTFGQYVRDHGHLPDTLNLLDNQNLLRDPIQDHRLLSYKRFDRLHGLVYSFGFDNEDNDGLFPYNSDYDYLIQLPSVEDDLKDESFRSLYSNEEFVKIRGDICVFLFVEINETSGESELRLASIYGDLLAE
ncbi:MAG: hypothetical protein KC964_08665 [Candidatus Omnitrophica bacterium]|nr:hypothetical protein [Candidatus Omnitrophota bacterium]